jgi:hypothetical protein
VTRARVFVALAAVLSACSDWRAQVVPGLAVANPTQTNVEARPTSLMFGKTAASLLARARYSTKAWVVAEDDDFDDPFAEVMPIDVALAWGPVANPQILEEMSFHLARRYVSIRWSGDMPLDQQAVMGHLANHHLIASTDEVSAQLARVRTGDLLSLEGYLVDVDAAGQKIRTSLSRDDIGNGSCEILWVERAEIATPTPH